MVRTLTSSCAPPAPVCACSVDQSNSVNHVPRLRQSHESNLGTLTGSKSALMHPSGRCCPHPAAAMGATLRGGMGTRRGAAVPAPAGAARQGSRKPAKSAADKLELIWRAIFRKTGFLRPTWVPALRDLRPQWRRLRAPPEREIDGWDSPIAAAVCAAVQKHAESLLLFGDAGVECNPGDSVILFGTFDEQAHRDCPALSSNFFNMQFIAILRGTVSCPPPPPSPCAR
jgi:hypothetical protein